MTTKEFISTIPFQINCQLNKGVKVEEMHLCKTNNVIGVRGRNHIYRNHILIHNFSKREITHGLSTDEWKQLVKKINLFMTTETIFLGAKKNKPKGVFSWSKWLVSEQNKSSEIERDVIIVTKPWLIAI